MNRNLPSLWVRFFSLSVEEMLEVSIQSSSSFSSSRSSSSSSSTWMTVFSFAPCVLVWWLAVFFSGAAGFRRADRSSITKSGSSSNESSALQLISSPLSPYSDVSPSLVTRLAPNEFAVREDVRVWVLWKSGSSSRNPGNKYRRRKKVSTWYGPIYSGLLRLWAFCSSRINRGGLSLSTGAWFRRLVCLCMLASTEEIRNRGLCRYA